METIIKLKQKNVPFQSLIKTITIDYHSYFKKTLPALSNLLLILSKRENKRIQNLDKINKLFSDFKELLNQHISKEIFILFPIIKKLDTEESLKVNITDFKKMHQQTFNDNIMLLAILNKINSLTNNYEPIKLESKLQKQCFMDLKSFENNCRNYFELKKKHFIHMLN